MKHVYSAERCTNVGEKGKIEVNTLTSEKFDFEVAKNHNSSESKRETVTERQTVRDRERKRGKRHAISVLVLFLFSKAGEAFTVAEDRRKRTVDTGLQTQTRETRERTPFGWVWMCSDYEFLVDTCQTKFS